MVATRRRDGEPTYEGVERRGMDDVKWHLRKEVSVGQIVAILSVAASMLMGWAALDKRVTVLEAESVHFKEANARTEQLVRDAVARIEAAIIRMEYSIGNKQDKKGR
jgi:hypothetical protein